MKKLISWFLRLIVAFALISMLIAVKDALLEGTENILEFLWRALSAIVHDIWIVGAHFLHQSGDNLAELVRNAEFDEGFNPFRWFLGVPLYIFIALCQTGVWWLKHGSTVDGVLYVIGVPVLALLALPHLGNINLGGGGGGGRHH